jgi:hypothetical protein
MLGVGLKTLPSEKENGRDASKKFSRSLWRRPRPKLVCRAKERRRRSLWEVGFLGSYQNSFIFISN